MKRLVQAIIRNDPQRRDYAPCDVPHPLDVADDIDLEAAARQLEA